MSLPDPLSTEGSQALRAIIASPSETLIATDFDGTLAPIVETRRRHTPTPVQWRRSAGSVNGWVRWS
jgi:hypothetical protein